MPKDLRSFLKKLEAEAPELLVRVPGEVDPRFEITALLQNLEREGQYPVVIFEQVKNLKGQPSGIQVVSNLFADRRAIALALDLPKEKWRLETSLEYQRRQSNLIKPQVISRDEAPVKEVVKMGDEVDLHDLPVLTCHAMDAGAFLNDAVIAPDPDTGVYNASHHRQQIKGQNITGLAASPRHLWSYMRRAEDRGEGLPMAHVLGHHPGFYLGAEALVPMETDEYEVMGGILDEPLRLVPSEAFGDRLLVPADAEIVIEQEVIPGTREAEGPYGEWTGYFSPQTLNWMIKIRAITHRRDPYYMGIFVGHPDSAHLGSIPKEGGLFQQIKNAVPTVQAVYLPWSGTCRLLCYVSIAQQAEGEARVAALATLPLFDEIKYVVVVDDDIDVFDERQVLWAVATRTQPAESVDIIRQVRGGTSDPSQMHPTQGSKMIIDATRPLDRPFPVRLSIPQEALQKMKPEAWLAAKDLTRLGINR